MPHRISFKHAFEGVTYVVKNHPNMKVHGFIGLLVVGLGWWLNISLAEWLILVWTIILVLVAEMINTSVESMTNLITLEYREQAKIAKDVSAGMVLIMAMGAVVVGLIIFLPKLLG